MANDEHVKLLCGQSVEQWNNWRKEHQNDKLDLTDANLVKANLEGANLSGLDLSEAGFYGAQLHAASLINANLSFAQFKFADLRHAYLIGADLHNACFEHASLFGADLSDANLQHADLRLASLRRANLSNADLSHAWLNGVDLRGSNLTGANLNHAYLGNVDLLNTVFADVDLSNTEGLDHCFHHGPSVLDHRTLARSVDLPVPFVRGCGVDEETIDFFRTRANAPIRYYRSFISYSHNDKDFAQKLHAALQNRGIRCWLDEHQSKPGASILDELNQAIRTSDKLVLCCSKSSLNSSFVEDEILMARERERKSRKREAKVSIIIPLDLDGYIRRWNGGLASYIRSRVVASFKGWKHDDTKFTKPFEGLVKALTADRRG